MTSRFIYTRNMRLCGIIAGTLLAAGCDSVFTGDPGFPIASPDVNVEVNVDGPTVDVTNETIVDQELVQQVDSDQNTTATQNDNIPIEPDAHPGDRVVICHFPPGNPDNPRTLVVNESALPAHLRHGDTLGPCCENDEDCQDDLFCNGDEFCDHATCIAGAEPCEADEICDEDADRCVDCLDDADCDDGDLCHPGTGDCVVCLTDEDCDDGLFCTGTESCDPVAGECVSSGDPCQGGEICNELDDMCAPCEPGAWEFGFDMPLARNVTQAAKDSQGRVYIPGGVLGLGPGGPNTPQFSVLRFDENAELGNQWETLSEELNVARSEPAVATDDLGRIYAIGGNDGTSLHRSVERYDPANPASGWTMDEGLVPWLPSPRSGMHAVTDSGGKIYVTGGNDIAGQIFGSVLVFDPSNPGLGWLPHSDMNKGRKGFGFTIDSQDRIYAIGGSDETGRLDSVERFDLDDPAAGWVFVDSINSSRQVGVAIADCDDLIYAVGGWPPYTCIVERFDPVTEAWEVFDSINECRNNMAGVLGDSGRLYTFGGDAGFTSQSTVESFELCACK